VRSSRFASRRPSRFPGRILGNGSPLVRFAVLLGVLLGGLIGGLVRLFEASVIGGRKRRRGVGFGRGVDIPNNCIVLWRRDGIVGKVPINNTVVLLVVFIGVAIGIFVGTILGLVVRFFDRGSIAGMLNSILRIVLGSLSAPTSKANRNVSVGVFGSSGIGNGDCSWCFHSSSRSGHACNARNEDFGNEEFHRSG
jgi:hypothetical protein